MFLEVVNLQRFDDILLFPYIVFEEATSNE